MSYIVSFSDITEFRGDAILNSLGVDGRVYGRLCENIMSKCMDPVAKECVDSHVDGKIGDIFRTGAGRLPCKNIIHVVTPFKRFDKNNECLKKMYSDVIKFAIDRGYKTLALPFIGTGANGYSEEDAYYAVATACGEINELEEAEDRDIISITVIAYLKKEDEDYSEDCYLESIGCVGKDYMDSLDGCLDDASDGYVNNRPSYLNNRKRNAIICGVEKTGACCDKNYINIFKVINFYKNIDMSKSFIPNSSVDFKLPFDYIDNYIYNKELSETLLTRNGMDRKRKFQLRKQKTITKKDIYRIAVLLGMNKTEVVEFMIVDGVSFSPLDKMDMFFIDYLDGKYGKAKNLFQLDEKAYGIIDEDDYFVYGEM